MHLHRVMGVNSVLESSKKDETASMWTNASVSDQGKMQMRFEIYGFSYVVRNKSQLVMRYALQFSLGGT